MIGKILSSIVLISGLLALALGIALYFYGMPVGDMCSPAILASDYSHIAEAEREGACLDDSFKGLAMVSALTVISLVGGGFVSLIGSIWACFAWRKSRGVVNNG